MWRSKGEVELSGMECNHPVLSDTSGQVEWGAKGAGGVAHLQKLSISMCSAANKKQLSRLVSQSA